MDQQGHGLFQALERLERRAESSASGWRLLLYAVILAPLAAVVDTFVYGVEDLPITLAAITTLCLAGVSFWYSFSLRREVRRALGESSMAQLIASGDLEPLGLRSAMPWPWRHMIPSTPGLEGALRRIGNDLDWYLNASNPANRGNVPRKLIRLSWILVPLVPAIAAVLIWLGYQDNVQHHLRNHDFQAYPGTLKMWIAGVLLASGSVLHYRRQVWHEELARYLRRTLEADEAPDSRADAAPGAGAAPDKAD